MALLKDIFRSGAISNSLRIYRLLTVSFWDIWKKEYINKPRTNPQLKNNIHNKFEAITLDFMENVLERARMCESENGHHLIIFHN